MLQANINGKSREFGEGISILDALGAMGIEVPTLCHDRRLKPIGGCRLCVVNVQGWSHPATACVASSTSSSIARVSAPRSSDVSSLESRDLARASDLTGIARIRTPSG